MNDAPFEFRHLRAFRRWLQWHRREFSNTRSYRKAHERPAHLPRWYWRFMEYRYLYYVVKHVVTRA